MNYFNALFLAFFSICSVNCFAVVLEPIGPVYPIAESSAIDMIMKKLKDKQRTGELKRLQEAAQMRAENHVKNIDPVLGISTVVDRASRLIDPTVTYTHAVTTEDGRIVVPAGARINPLVITSLSKRLVFFDGRDPDQLEAVHRLVVREGARVKPILVAGSWFDTSKAWQTQVYFDQKGTLSHRFGIDKVPTVISQRGDQLLLEEIPAGDLK